jgi:two-component system, NtrC family, sensor kinase
LASVLVPLLAFLGACWYDRGVVLDEERTQIAATLGVLAQHVQSMMQESTLALDLEVNETKAQGWPAIRQSQQLTALLRRLSDSLPEVADAFVVDRDGVVAAASDSGVPVGADVRDQDLFRRARADPDSLVISSLTAPAPGQAQGATFVISRALLDHGRFDGVAVVSVWLAYFRNLFEPILDTQRSATATLLRADGTDLFRYPSVLAPGGGPGPDSAAIRQAALGPGVRMFIAPSASDGREKIGAAEAIPGRDLTIAYWQDKRQVLGEWYGDLPLFAAIAAASAMVLLFTTWRAVLAEERRRRAETALLQAGKMEALGRLTGGVAHDFNNLLVAILGSIELLQPRVTEPGDRQQLAIAERAAQRGAKLIAQMLAFARNSPVTPVAVDVNALVRDADELVRRTGGAIIRVRHDLQSGLWWALADPVQLELSLLNLVANARDAMPEGGELTVRTRNLSAREARSTRLPERDYVILEVKDTGRGMSENERNSAFEPFFTTKQPGKGTGLGLSMVYGFVRQLGGTAAIQSRPGATTVSLFLPRASFPADEQPGPPHLALTDCEARP